MTGRLQHFLLFTVIATFASTVQAAPIVYPADGQDQAQQDKDEGECLVWARNRTGFDPLAKSDTQVAQAEQRRGGALRGAAGGAAVGAIVGDSDDAKKGAAAGAVVGRMRQNRQNREARRSAQADVASTQAASSANRQEFDRAYAACLEGRGYTVR